MKKRCISFIRKSTIAVFCTFTAFSHCLFGYASNDDEYITFKDAETIQAYQYFYRYGFTGDESYTYTDTYTTKGNISESANITLSSSGGSFSGSGTSASDIIGQWRDGSSGTTLSLSIPNDKIVAQLDPTSTTPSHLTLACTYNTPTDLAPAPSDYDYEYTKMTCTDSGFVDVSRYTVTLKPTDSGVYLTGFTENSPTYLKGMDDPLYDPETNSALRIIGANSFSGSLSLTENGSFSGTGSVSLTTTTTNTNKLSYVLPFLSVNNITNPDLDNINTSFQYSWIYQKNEPFIISYFSKGYVSPSNMLNFSVYKRTSENIAYSGDYIFKLSGRSSYSVTTGGLYLVTIETKPNLDIDTTYYFNFYGNKSPFSDNIIPLYVGYKRYMSDSLYRYIYGSDRIIESLEKQTNIIENGNTNSQQKGQQLNNQTTQMQNKMNQFQNIEDTAGDNMNTALNNINTNPSLLSNNKFLVSADWIRQQFNRIVTNTPFEAVITFCLVFGLGLLLLGKVR